MSNQDRPHAAQVALTSPAAAHPDSRPIEMVERKGRGHPDSICDALAESFSIGLSRFYHRCFGAILHHNVDKVLLAAGSSRPSFGGGEVTAPLDVYLAGRATCQIGDTVIPVAEIAEESSRAWLQANLHALDPARHVRIHPVVRPGSAALGSLIARGSDSSVVANDTSLAVGYAPGSRLERVVLAVEQALTHPATIATRPVIGEDVKVMGVRVGQEIEVIVACAIVDRHVRNTADYSAALAEIERLARDVAQETSGHRVSVTVNAADDVQAGRLYLTATGTSAEAGDDGQTGRGNRVGGLITPYRPMTLEAAAGKNVVSHVGKTYTITAHRISQQLIARCPEIAEATCILVSRIGHPVQAPPAVELQVRTRDGHPPELLREPAEEIVAECLDEMTGLANLLLDKASLESPAEWPGILLF